MSNRDPFEERAVALRQQLSSTKPDEIDRVWNDLSQMPADDAVSTVLCLLRLEARTERLMLRIAFAGAGGGLAIVTLCAWFFEVNVPFGPFLAFPLTFLPTTFALIHTRRERLYECLASYNDIRVVDTLVQAIGVISAQSRNALISPLTKLLPQLRPSESGLLSPRSRTILNERLLSTKDSKFVLAILAAWEQIGDASSIPFVERLARGEGRTGNNNAVRQAAIEALPAIRTAADRNSASQTLLRSSESVDSAYGLLRTASVATAVQQSLLQASSDQTWQPLSDSETDSSAMLTKE